MGSRQKELNSIYCQIIFLVCTHVKTHALLKLFCRFKIVLMFIKYRIHITILIGKSPWNIKILFSWNIPRILYHYRYNFRFPACPRLCSFLIYSSITLIFLLDSGFRLVSRACTNCFNPMLLILFLLVDNSHVLTFSLWQM